MPAPPAPPASAARSLVYLLTCRRTYIIFHLRMQAEGASEWASAESSCTTPYLFKSRSRTSTYPIRKGKRSQNPGGRMAWLSSATPRPSRRFSRAACDARGSRGP